VYTPAVARIIRSQIAPIDGRGVISWSRCEYLQILSAAERDTVVQQQLGHPMERAYAYPFGLFTYVLGAGIGSEIGFVGSLLAFVFFVAVHQFGALEQRK
jgi:hypothetical protein